MFDGTSSSGYNPRRITLFYGWIILFALFLIQFVLYGTWYTFGVFLKYLAEDLGSTRALISGVISLASLAYGLGGTLTGVIVDRWGPRVVTTACVLLTGLGYLLASQATALWHLYLLLGLVMGIGMSVAYVVPNVTVTRWFDRRRGLSLGILFASIGSGQVIMPPLARYLISEYGWQTAFLALGILIWVVAIPASMLLKRSPQDMGLLPDGRSEPDRMLEKDLPAKSDLLASWSFGEAVRTRAFWFLFTMIFFLAVSIQIVYVHLFPYASDVGVAPAVAATVLSVLGLGQILGGITIGGISDRLGDKPTFLAGLAVFAVTLFNLIVARELWALYLLTLAMGISYGGTQPVYLKIVARLFGPAAMGAIFGVLMVAWTVGKSLGPTLAGYIFDVTGDYNLAFVVTAAAALIALFLILLVKLPKRTEGSR